MITALPGTDPGKVAASMKLFAKEVLPHFRRKDRAQAKRIQLRFSGGSQAQLLWPANNSASNRPGSVDGRCCRCRNLHNS